jgi:hypothetical protein
MRIGILGAGNIGGTLGRRWAEQGHSIFYGVRDTQSASVQALLAQPGFTPQMGSVSEAAAFGEVVLLAVPGNAATATVAQVPDWGGTILIDASNGPPAGYSSLGEAVATHAHNARVVKAFNTAGYEIYANPQFGALAADLFVCGDHATARRVVGGLAREIGLTVRDMGKLQNARLLEALAMTWIYLAMQSGELGRNIAIKVLER